jgi:YHS domain-containing protein
MAIDPICKMKVEEDSAEFVSENNGEKYYFCCAGCKKNFDKNPEKYID